MTKVQALQHAIERLSPEELATFRAWFADYGSQAWDRQLGRDIAAGKLDAIAAEALAEHEKGQTTKL